MLSITEGTWAAAFAGLMVVSASGLLAFGEVFRRFIGVIYLHQDGKTVRVAHISFWGKRKDFLVKVEDFKLVSETNADINDAVWKVEFYDKSIGNMLISTRFGGVQDRDRFQKIFGAESLATKA